ncbi:MAG: hypothetical protein F6K28_28145 [Microcoleus sp. SIO2G3]|nr:hypothetical protein [Microcoleus sp. SIO2G3]
MNIGNCDRANITRRLLPVSLDDFDESIGKPKSIVPLRSIALDERTA